MGKTLMGEQLTVTKSWRGVRINGKAKVTTADVAATNGVVHIIDTVLIPNKIASSRTPCTKRRCRTAETTTRDLLLFTAKLKFNFWSIVKLRVDVTVLFNKKNCC